MLQNNVGNVCRIEEIFHNFFIFKLINCCVAAAVMLLASCNDFLEPEIMNKQSADDSYESVEDIDQALIGVYGSMRPLSLYYWQMSECHSDNVFVNSSRVRPASIVAHFESSFVLESSIVLDCWNNYFKLVAAANKFLDEIDHVDFSGYNVRMATVGWTADKLKEHYKAEARFLRAFAYFDLVRFFGRVPAPTHELSVEEGFNLKQSEPQDVYHNIIIPDLQYAVEHLEYIPYNYLAKQRLERVTKPAAQAMLGRVYLTLSGFPYYESYETEATELFKIIIDYSAAHSNKWWAPNMTEWNKQWIHENDNKYPIFEIQYAMTQGMGNPMTPYCSGDMQPYTDWAKKGFLVADVSMITPDDLIKHFTTEPETDADGNEYVDQRGPMTFSGFELNEQGEYDEGTEGNQFNIKFIEYIKKRATLGYATIDDQMVDRTCWPQNFPIIRFEDVLLMYAELVGPTTDGYAAINRIRTRAGLPALSGLSADDFQQAVRRERQYELAGEGQRWHDLVRWNVYVDTMKKVYADTPYAAFVKAESYLYPIPWVQMKVREGLYEQNPGY